MPSALIFDVPDMTMDLAAILAASIGLYAIITGIFLISENRRPQSTLAWMFAFLLAPVIGLLFYIFFGRNRKAFVRERKLMKQDLEDHVIPILLPLLSRQNTDISRLEIKNPSHRKLLQLVRRNSESVLTTFNSAEIQQNASMFYSSIVKDLKAAQHSIHLQYFIWRVDDFTQHLKSILAAKVRSGVEVRLLYDPLGSQVILNSAYD